MKCFTSPKSSEKSFSSILSNTIKLREWKKKKNIKTRAIGTAFRMRWDRRWDKGEVGTFFCHVELPLTILPLCLG